MVLQGTEMMSFVADNETGQLKSIGGATSHTLTLNQSTRSISTKDWGSGRWAMNTYGMLDWSVSSDHYVIDSDNNQKDGEFESQFSTLDDSRYGLGYSDMFNYMVSRKPVYVVIGLEGTSKDFNENKADHPDSSTNGWTVNEKYPRWGGYAIITSLTKNMPNDDTATYSIEMVGTGALKPITPNPTTTYKAENPVQVTAKKVDTVKA